MSRNKRTLLIYVFLLSSLVIVASSWSSFSKLPKSIKKTIYSDNIKIKSVIYTLEQSIKNHDINRFSRILAKDIKGDNIMSKAEMKQCYQLFVDNDINNTDQYKARRKPKSRRIFTNWDFEIEIQSIDNKNKGRKADVLCEIYFAFDQPDDISDIDYGKGPKKNIQKIKLNKIEDKWYISNVNSLFSFLKTRKTQLESY